MKTKILILIGLMAVLPAAFAGETFDASFNRMVVKWTEDRDEIVRDLSRQWLRGARPEDLQARFHQLVRVEVRLATAQDVPLYVNAISDPQDPDRMINEVLMQYLREREVDFRSRDLFAGRSYQILTDPPAVASNGRGGVQRRP